MTRGSQVTPISLMMSFTSDSKSWPMRFARLILVLERIPDAADRLLQRINHTIDFVGFQILLAAFAGGCGLLVLFQITQKLDEPVKRGGQFLA